MGLRAQGALRIVRETFGTVGAARDDLALPGACLGERGRRLRAESLLQRASQPAAELAATLDLRSRFESAALSGGLCGDFALGGSLAILSLKGDRDREITTDSDPL
jgi:hypothetical protein